MTPVTLSDPQKAVKEELAQLRADLAFIADIVAVKRELTYEDHARLSEIAKENQ